MLLHAEIDVDGTNLTVVATHFSPPRVRRRRSRPGPCGAGLPPADRPAVLVGDMNMWGWTIDAMTPPGWRRAVRGKTWPRPRPRHQIDHLLVTRASRSCAARCCPTTGSDHLPDPSPAAGHVSGDVSHPVVFLCTGNAARSVMGGAALAAHLPDWHVTTAGTLVVEGQPMSWRTKAALDSVGLGAPVAPQPAGDRRRAAPCCARDRPRPGARALGAPHPPRGGRRAPRTLRRLARDLPAHDAPLPERVASLDLADVELGDWEEVVDPGGGDAEDVRGLRGRGGRAGRGARAAAGGTVTMTEHLTADEAAALLHPVDTIGMPLGPGQPPAFLEALGRRTDWEDLRIIGALLTRALRPLHPPERPLPERVLRPARAAAARQRRQHRLRAGRLPPLHADPRRRWPRG